MISGAAIGMLAFGIIVLYVFGLGWGILRAWKERENRNWGRRWVTPHSTVKGSSSFFPVTSLTTLNLRDVQGTLKTPFHYLMLLAERVEFKARTA